MNDPAQPWLRVDAGSRAWRRRLGALPWAALEELALTAHLTNQGWVAIVGVRQLATSIGVTKDTAARSVAALRTAGLVTFERVDGPDGRSRSGYRLRLPDGIDIRTPPTYPGETEQQHEAAGGCPDRDDNPCPAGEYGEGRCGGETKASTVRSAPLRVRDRGGGTPLSRPAMPGSAASDGVVQPTLFADLATDSEPQNIHGLVNGL
jgi:hypothetical protein